MKFYQRLAYYLSGFALGIFFLMMILNGKDTSCSYFPNARVLKNLRSKPFYYSETAKQKLNQKWVDTSDIRRTLTYGDVDFSKSNIKVKGGKLFIIEGKTTKNLPIVLEVINNENKAYLVDIKR
jgi:hypothetical protein